MGYRLVLTGPIAQSTTWQISKGGEPSGTKENCDALTYEEDKRLSELQNKLEDAYPSLSENPPNFGQNEGMNINM